MVIDKYIQSYVEFLVVTHLHNLALLATFDIITKLSTTISKSWDEMHYNQNTKIERWRRISPIHNRQIVRRNKIYNASL